METGKSYMVVNYNKLPEYVSKVVPKFFMVTSVDQRNGYVEGVIGVDGKIVDSEVMVWTKSGIRFFHIPEEYYHCFREVEVSYSLPVSNFVPFLLEV